MSNSNIQVLHTNGQQNPHVSKAVRLIMLSNSFTKTIFIATADGVGGPKALQIC